MNTLLASLLIILLLSSTGCVSAIHLATLKKLPDERYSFLRLDGFCGKTRVFRSGKSGQPTILYVHGNLGSAYDFTLSPLYQSLKDDFEVITYDRPGFGFSTRGCLQFVASPDFFAEHLQALIKQLDVKKPLIIGHSWGGAVALAHATKYQQSAESYTLLAPAAYSWPDFINTVGQNILQATPLFSELYLQTVHLPLASVFGPARFKKIALPTPLPAPYITAALPLAINPQNYQNAARDTLGLHGALKEQSEKYRNISKSITVFADPEDQIVWPTIHTVPLTKSAQNARYIELPETGHIVHFSKEYQKIAEQIRSRLLRTWHPESD